MFNLLLILLHIGLELALLTVITKFIEPPVMSYVSSFGSSLGYIILIQGFSFFFNWIMSAQDELNELRPRLYRHLQRLPIRFYDQKPLGDILSRCTNDLEILDTFFSLRTISLIIDLARLVVLVSFVLIGLSNRFLWLTVLLGLLLFATLYIFRLWIQNAERQVQSAAVIRNTHLLEILGGAEVLRVFGREAVFVTRFRLALENVLKADTRSKKYFTVYLPVLWITIAFGIAFFVWGVIPTDLTGNLIGLEERDVWLQMWVGLWVVVRFSDCLIAVSEEWPATQSALSGAMRIFQILRLPVEKSTPAVGQDNCKGAGIAVQNLTFGYAAGQPVLQNVTFTVAPGEHVALVGRSGAGKSSLVNLLGGLYSPWTGKIEINGLDPYRMAEPDRHWAIGIAPQSVRIFSGTVLENLTLWDPLIGLVAVEHAVRIVGAGELISALPDGYQTLIMGDLGGRGIQLSPGQRQLLALVRALVRNPEILIFDEASSALDSASEAALRAALRVNPDVCPPAIRTKSDARRALKLGELAETAARRPAILTVTQRLAAAREADRVIVLDKGRIVEMGSPDELIRAGGRFAAMLELESAGWNWHRS